MAIIWVSSGQYCQWRLIIVIITNQREHLHNRLATTMSFNIDQELEVEDGFKMFKIITMRVWIHMERPSFPGPRVYGSCVDLLTLVQ